MELEMKVSIDNKQAKKLLAKYKPYLSRNDIGKLFKLILERPNEDIYDITEDYIAKKYSIDKITDLIEETQKKQVSFKWIMQKLHISKSRFYFRLNYLKRYYIKRNIDLIIQRSKITKRQRIPKDKFYINQLLKRKDTQRYILLNPGPVLTSPSVKNALVQYDMCHRDKDFQDLLAKLKRQCLLLFGADKKYRVLFISGSGTAGLEAALSSFIPEGKKVLVASNGAFGERLSDILTLHRIPVVYRKYPWGKRLNIHDLEQHLEEDNDIYAIAVNHHETSVGLLNPIHTIGMLAKKYKKIFIIDAISSLGAEKINVIRDNIDVCITSSNKCIHSVTGLSLVCAKQHLLDSLKEQRPRSYYLDVYKHYQYLENLNQTPYTPNITSFFALDAAVKELLEEGLENRRKKYIRRNSLLKSELIRLGFSFFTDSGDESHTILTVKVPEWLEYREFYNKVKSLGFLIYDCKPPLYGKYFQIANMGDLNEAMLYDFIFVVEKVLKEMNSGRKAKKKVLYNVIEI
ncbi:MAG: alanine--glyoxylate aminotransferase family protein [Nanoarchaeota archaeon]